MDQTSFNNRTSIVKDDLVANLNEGDSVSVAASSFSMYAYRELRDQLESLDSFRFLYTSRTFLAAKDDKEQREFYIPRLNREKSLLGASHEIRLKNELTQKAISRECADWIERKAQFRSFAEDDAFDGSFICIHGAGDDIAYQPFHRFTTRELGTDKSKPLFSRITREGTGPSRELLDDFDAAWNSEFTHDVKDAVVDSMSTMYRDNPPELIYYTALYNIFHEFLGDVTADELPKEGTGFRESKVWNLLYDFQRDAVTAIINKLQTHNGCILADSVGLGKTFTALAVIKYYELLNRNVLVLCPKRLSDNWVAYKQNYKSNPLVEDRLRYDVLYHTDLSRAWQIN